ncbi:hypothetical protein DFJ58DRAFT_804906 [Suillus subalutaceus]|uniref:uncharacterized protein n=1 Tax=Suillus subalutaceus TaxID=48586 RepID=UPI001B86C526|nr:uncharacterized protein DFJ58DRAFT_804906 [Suillus subalutaceus]KAG1843307.1 hypothetical protein DFJ58DRAFT_804906 [Suillus subalutaceus]
MLGKIFLLFAGLTGGARNFNPLKFLYWGIHQLKTSDENSWGLWDGAGMGAMWKSTECVTQIHGFLVGTWYTARNREPPSSDRDKLISNMVR